MLEIAERVVETFSITLIISFPIFKMKITNSVTMGGFKLQTFYKSANSVCPAGLGNCTVCKRFELKILPWLLVFLIHNKIRARYHQSFKLGSRLKYLDPFFN